MTATTLIHLTLWTAIAAVALLLGIAVLLQREAERVEARIRRDPCSHLYVLGERDGVERRAFEPQQVLLRWLLLRGLSDQTRENLFEELPNLFFAVVEPLAVETQPDQPLAGACGQIMYVLEEKLLCYGRFPEALEAEQADGHCNVELVLFGAEPKQPRQEPDFLDALGRRIEVGDDGEVLRRPRRRVILLELGCLLLLSLVFRSAALAPSHVTPSLRLGFFLGCYIKQVELQLLRDLLSDLY
mmetsp:Transcript_57973/g.136403  ORF Transcript_57973/g.136403 Transcript_57973/m.136403 type:complete len:243 (+) Transcript_57973:1731-2459(+)